MPSPATEAEQNRRDAKLYHWRADLLDYDADLLDSIGKTTEARLKREDAEHRRELGTLLAAFQEAANRRDSDPEDCKSAYATLDRARFVYREWRRSNSIPAFEVNLPGFDEPTDADLEV